MAEKLLLGFGDGVIQLFGPGLHHIDLSYSGAINPSDILENSHEYKERSRAQ